MMGSKLARWICAISLVVSVPCRPGFAQPKEPDRLPLAADIEERFDGFFLATTDGSGAYTIYQRLEDPLGVSRSDEVVCMMRECFLQLAAVPAPALESAGRDMGKVRERFRAVRDAYRTMRSAAPEARSAASDLWRKQIARIRPCIENTETC